MLLSRLVFVAIMILAFGCSSSKEAKSIKNLKLSMAKANVSKGQILITGLVVQESNGKSSILSTPLLIVNEGRKAFVRCVEERYLPEYWNSPKASKDKKEFVPPTPVFEEAVDFGVTIEVTGKSFKNKKGKLLVHLTGHMVISKLIKVAYQESLIESYKDVSISTESNKVQFSLCVTSAGKPGVIKAVYKGKTIIFKIAAKAGE